MKINKKEGEKIIEMYERRDEFRNYFAENYDGVYNMYKYFRKTRLSNVVKAIMHEVYWLVNEDIAYSMMVTDMNKGLKESYGAKILCKNNNKKIEKTLSNIIEGKIKTSIYKKLIALDGLKYHENDHSDIVLKLLDKTSNFLIRNACFDYLFYKRNNKFKNSNLSD